MSTNYSGNPANVSAALTRTIIGCSSGSGGKVLVQTSVSHLFSTYDYVNISGVTGTTEANGNHQITVVSADTFLLTTVTFVNAYVSGGTAVDISFTPSFSIPSDGEVLTSQNLFSGLQLVADRTQYIQKYLSQSLSFQRQTFTSSGTFTVPVNVTQVLVEICGGGGGGGGGSSCPTGTGSAAGGGGGGGAVLSTQLMAVTPNEVLGVTVGAGGTGGSGASPNPATGKTADGGDGGTSAVVGGSATVIARGGGHGTSGQFDDTNPTPLCVMSYGGAPISGLGTLTNAVDGNPGFFQLAPQVGGAALNKITTTSLVVRKGLGSPQGFTGGVAGTNGTDDSGAYGGGGGGGGGAGPFASGGGGGAGGNANTGTSTPVAGTNGTAGAANSGAGGGGGGASGAINGNNNLASSGGSGGSGLVIISYVGGTFT